MGGDRYEGQPEAITRSVRSVREARRIAQPRPLTPNWPDYPYRAVSIYPSIVFARLGVSANQITIIWIILGIAGVVALGSASYGVRAAGAVLLEISYVFDFVDGEVARLTSRTSKLGALLDLTGHGVIKTALFLAIGYGVFASTHRAAILILAILACAGVVNGHMMPLFAAEASPPAGSRQQAANSTAAARPSAKRRVLRSVGQTFYLFESPGIYLLVLLGAIFSRLEWVIVFYGFLGPLWFIYRLARYRP